MSKEWNVPLVVGEPETLEGYSTLEKKEIKDNLKVCTDYYDKDNLKKEIQNLSTISAILSKSIKSMKAKDKLLNFDNDFETTDAIASAIVMTTGVATESPAMFGVGIAGIALSAIRIATKDARIKASLKNSAKLASYESYVSDTNDILRRHLSDYEVNSQLEGIIDMIDDSLEDEKNYHDIITLKTKRMENK